MIKVYQTKFDEQDNSLQACIATITGIPLQDIPDWLPMAKWATSKGWKVTKFTHDENGDIPDPKGFSLVRLKEASKTGKEAYYSVVYHGNVLFHDPNPVRRLASIWDCYWTFEKMEEPISEEAESTNNLQAEEEQQQCLNPVYDEIIELITNTYTDLRSRKIQGIETIMLKVERNHLVVSFGKSVNDEILKMIRAVQSSFSIKQTEIVAIPHPGEFDFPFIAVRFTLSIPFKLDKDSLKWEGQMNMDQFERDLFQGGQGF